MIKIQNTEFISLRKLNNASGDIQIQNIKNFSVNLIGNVL